MASHQLLDNSNQVRDSYYPAKIIHGCSKAQASLSKILHTISSFSPYESGKGGLCGGNRGFGIDLNLRLGLSSEIEDSDTPSGEGRLSACSVVGELVETNSPELCDGSSTVDKSSEVEGSSFKRDSSTFEGKHEEEEEVVEKTTEVSEITNLQFQSFEAVNNGVCQENNKEEEEDQNESAENREEGFLGLLIEAARLVSGEFVGDESESAKPSQDDELSEKRGRDGRRRSMPEWYGDFEDVAPVVRTKRGRSQILPYRYRDSVIEPLKPLHNRSAPKRKKLSR